MNNPASVAQLGLTDDEIEAIALKYVAPGAKALREIVPGLAPYQQSWQFQRIKAFLVDALAARRAPVADERAAFEQGESASDLERDEEGDYLNPCVQASWGGWQARASLAGAPAVGEAITDLQALQWAEKYGIQWALHTPDAIREVIADAQRLAAPQASAKAFAKLQSAYIGACDQIGRLLAEKQASAPAAGEAQAAQFIQAAIDQAPEPLRRLGEYLSRVLDEDQWASAERMLLGACNAASKASAEELVRYCPGCGSVGPVEGEYRDCCPDGDEARMIPIALAKKCRDTFSVAVQGLLADRQRRDARNENVRTGHPFDVPAFDELCREHDVLGTAMSALCAVFWRAAEQQPAPEPGDRKAWEADMLAAGATHLGGDCWEWEVEDFEFKIWQMGVRRRQRTTEGSSGGGNGHAA